MAQAMTIKKQALAAATPISGDAPTVAILSGFVGRQRLRDVWREIVTDDFWLALAHRDSEDETKSELHEATDHSENGIPIPRRFAAASHKDM